MKKIKNLRPNVLAPKRPGTEKYGVETSRAKSP